MKISQIEETRLSRLGGGLRAMALKYMPSYETFFVLKVLGSYL